jgi:hypothetical protein
MGCHWPASEPGQARAIFLGDFLGLLREYEYERAGLGKG